MLVERSSRSAQPYAAVALQGSMAEVIAGLSEIWAELSVWLAHRGIAASGPPFIAYRSIRMPQWLAVEVGIPTATLASADGHVLCGELPAGDYMETLYVGHYDGLLDATAKLLKWAAKQDIEWDMQVRDGAEQWAARVESYITDPTEEPDPTAWQTRVAIKVNS